jgi:hypothetical protein
MLVIVSVIRESDSKSSKANDKYREVKTTYASLPFNKYQSDRFSQNGEDGVIAEILKRLDLLKEKSWCVEFGAWDGKHLSNTFALVDGHDFRAVFIEGDRTRFNDLLETATQYPQIVPVCAYVSAVSDDSQSLDKILMATGIPSSFTLLSIDIDSFDLDVWESLTHYEPIVVVIEINSSVPPGIVWRHSRNTQGNTFSATCNVASRKGYTLVCHTGNLVFVRNDHVGNLNIEDRYVNYPELLFQFDSEWLAPELFTISTSRTLLEFISNALQKITPKLLKRIIRRVLR